MCKIEHRIQGTFQMKKMNKYFVCLKKKKTKGLEFGTKI